ncbi:MAG: hypothetical protein II090_04145 [Elusimicrobia bacterium]|nr:hypothetical protein [Elusimicrobiota bacterium]
MLLDEQNDIRRNITTIGLPIVLLVILFMLFIYKLYGGGESELYKLTQTDKSYLMVYVTNECNTCKDVEKRLKDKDIKYYELNLNKEKKTTEILSKFDIDRSKLSPPALIYIKNGKLYAYEDNINDVDTFNNFVDKYLR